MSFYSKIFNAFERIIFPNGCFECGKQTEGQFCCKCFDMLFCPQIRSFVRGGVRIRVLSAMRYSPGVAKLINSKFAQKPKAFDQAGQIMAKALGTIYESTGFSGVLVPVPCHWTKSWSRGFNQSQVLAQSISRASGLEILSLLIKTRATASQASTKTRVERVVNVSNCFSINPKIDVSSFIPNFNSEALDQTGLLSEITRAQNIILVDDLITSGATLLQCAKVVSDLTRRPTINALVLSAKDSDLGE